MGEGRQEKVGPRSGGGELPLWVVSPPHPFPWESSSHTAGLAGSVGGCLGVVVQGLHSPGGQ